jgi:hypothetical protein
MAHLDPVDLEGRPEHFVLRGHLLRHLHHTQHMLFAAGLSALTIVVVAAVIMMQVG